MNYKEALVPLFPKLKITPLLGGFDMNLGNPSFEESDLKICIVQNGDFFTKATSATVIQLCALMREAERELGIKIYVDFAFQPDCPDVETLRANKLHEVFAWSSFRTLDEFDALLCSFSIHYETMGVCTVLWGAGIPAHFYERLNQKKCPILLSGGVVGQLLEPVFGHTKGSLVDALYLGEAEDRLPAIVGTMYRNIELWRSGREGKIEFLKKLTETYDNFYVPNAYTHLYGTLTPAQMKLKYDCKLPIPERPRLTEFTEVPGTLRADDGPASQMMAIQPNYEWTRPKINFYRSFNPRPPMFENRLLLTTNDGASRGELQISHGALTGDTAIATEEGLMTLEHIFRNQHLLKQEEGYQGLKVWTAQGWKRVLAVHDAGKQAVRRITTVNGRELSITSDHKVSTGAGFTAAADIVPSMEVAVWDGFRVQCVAPWQKVSQREAYLLGFIQGDGSVTKSGNVVVYCNPQERDHIRSVLDDVGWEYREDRAHAKNVTAFHVLTWACKMVRGFFRHSPGYHPTKAFKKEASYEISKYSLEHQKAFLRGWFDADGTATPYREKLSSASKKDLLVAQNLLHNLGVNGFISYETSEKGIQKGIREIWHLCFDRVNFLKFTEVVGFDLPYKKALCVLSSQKSDESRFDGTWSPHFVPLVAPEGYPHQEVSGGVVVREPLVNVGIMMEKVVSVIDCVPTQVYDLSVEDCPEYAANGIRVENCMGFGACYFCAEGNEAGVWREYDIDAIVENMEKLKQASAPNVISFFSFNTNYYSKIFDLYYEVAKRFNYISVIAFRADVVSAVPEYIRFLKALGTFRLTIALEGISERIRAAFLNKNLTWEQYLRTCEYVFREKFVMLKTNLIFSGHEEKEDIEEFVQAMQKMNELKEKYGAKTSIVWSMTTLVTYWNCGLQWQPRKATIAEIFRERKFKDAVRRGRELGHRFRFNSGSEFVWQQLLVDGGRRISDTAVAVYRKFWESNRPINTSGFFDELNDEVFIDLGILDKEVRQKTEVLKEKVDAKLRLVADEESMVDLANQESVAKVGQIKKELEEVTQEWGVTKALYETPIRGFFEREYGFNEIHPSETFNILPPFVRKIYYMAVGKRGTKYCLRSPATPDTKCKTCGFCEDDAFSKDVIVSRNITSNMKVEDVEKAIFLNKPKTALRVVYQTNPEILHRHRFKIVNNHVVASRFLKAEPMISRDFHSCGNYSDYVKTFHDQPDSWAGLGFFEIYLRCSAEELRGEVGDFAKLIATVNSGVESCKVLAVHVLPYTANNLREVTDVWRFETKIPKVQLMEAFTNYAGQMKVMDKGASAMAEIVNEPYPKEKFSLFTVQSPRVTMGFFTLSGRYNPYLAIFAFFGYKVQLAKELFKVDRVGAFDMIAIPCPGCGNPNGMDIMTNKPSRACPHCVAKIWAVKTGEKLATIPKTELVPV